MGYFLALHRSIVDPKFYKEILDFSRSAIFIYLVKLLLLISLVSSAAQCYYFIFSKKGIPYSLESTLKGMEIKNNLLDPKAPTPIIPPTFAVMPALDQLFGFQNFFASDKDSVVIIDTAKTRSYVMKIPAILLDREKIIFFVNKQNTFELPYKTLTFGKGNLVFTADEIRKLLIKNIGIIYISMLIANTFQHSITIIFSIFFLAIAAFFFRMERDSTIGKYFRAACFAITPMALGVMLISISGVKILWGWHLLIFISTVVLFRGLVAMASSSATNDSGER